MKFQIIPATPFQQNSSLIWDEQTMQGAVVDPGGDIERILAAIKSKGVSVEKILITHGHLDHAGHAAELAIVGDVLFRGSIGRTNFPKGNHADLINAIRNKLFVLPDDVEFIPGHDPMSTIGDEKEGNPFVADRKFG